jgi:hypothetical protein
MLSPGQIRSHCGSSGSHSSLLVTAALAFAPGGIACTSFELSIDVSNHPTRRLWGSSAVHQRVHQRGPANARKRPRTSVDARLTESARMSPICWQRGDDGGRGRRRRSHLGSRGRRFKSCQPDKSPDELRFIRTFSFSVHHFAYHLSRELGVPRLRAGLPGLGHLLADARSSLNFRGSSLVRDFDFRRDPRRARIC